MWSGQHQQSAELRIPPQLASIIMTKENVVFYSKTLDCFFYLFFLTQRGTKNSITASLNNYDQRKCCFLI